MTECHECAARLKVIDALLAILRRPAPQPQPSSSGTGTPAWWMLIASSGT